VDERLKHSFVGGPATVKNELESFLDKSCGQNNGCFAYMSTLHGCAPLKCCHRFEKHAQKQIST
jgi:hypothetical protein